MESARPALHLTEKPLGRLGFTYALSEANLNVGHGTRLGIGVQTGLITDVVSYWKSHLMMEALFYEWKEQSHENKFSAIQTFSIHQGYSLSLSLTKENGTFKNQAEAKIHWNHYF